MEPADEPLLAARFARLARSGSAADTLAWMQTKIPLFAEVNPLVFRELMLGSEIHVPAPGEIIFRKHDYTNSFFTIVEGEVVIDLLEEEGAHQVSLSAGQFFGEMSLLSGRRRRPFCQPSDDGCRASATRFRTRHVH